LTPSEALLDALSRRLPPEWWRPKGRLGDEISGPGGFDRSRFLAKYAAATRKLGTAVTTEIDERVARAGLTWLFEKAPVDELGRIGLLVLAAKLLSPGQMVDLCEDCFRHGDNGERRAVLRSLSLLPSPKELTSLGAQACRSHVQTVFEALAGENPFPAAYFDDLAFNQMVLKALFTGVKLERIVGLDERRTPELARMAADYAAERRAAGRTVPEDIGRVLAS
jgi:hypothetical protein